MSTTQSLILNTTHKICADLVDPGVLDAVAEGAWPKTLWDEMANVGLPFASASEAIGGVGLSLPDAYAPLTVTGRYAAPVPLADTLVAGHLLSDAGIDMPKVPFSVVIANTDAKLSFDGEKLSGTAVGVPFGRHIKALIIVLHEGDTSQHILVDQLDADIEFGFSIAGEPFDNLSFTQGIQARVLPNQSVDRTQILLALTRVLLMAGALESVLEMSVQYALEREQFGQPIAKFQAIQQQLAVAAGETAAAVKAAQSAQFALGTPLLSTEVAIAKARVGEAAGLVSEIGHQVHGAIGFTYEHTLHYRTRRLWAWRDEAGNEAKWQARLGRAIAAEGAEALWEFIVNPKPI